ncbi:ribonuclease H-like domain protein [Vibrio phage 1.081.O._10N.286.52.C2]|nr:ribonuclease H-like domain protein [Vibrio phage 1.081.O._10N.286.52.C2]
MFDWESIEVAINNSHPSSTVYVGCDSKRKSDMISYATVIIIHFEGNKGAQVFKVVETEPAYMSCKDGIRSRLMTEVYKAGEAAMKVKPMCGTRGFEVHVDINPDPAHKSHVAYNEAKGTIFGYVGQEPVFKPDAFAASCAADYDAVRRADKVAKRKELRKAKRKSRRHRNSK